MAFSLGSNSNDDDPVAEINVTPFVDVVLVLLIIFMITAAVVEFGMQIGVPPTTTATQRQSKESNNITVLSDGRLARNGREINLYDIVPEAKRANPDSPQVTVRIHRMAAWDVVAQLLAECKAGDIEINLVPQPLRRDPRVSR